MSCASWRVLHHLRLRRVLVSVRARDVQLARRSHPSDLDDDLVHPAVEHRDTQAIHAKLDELLRSDPNAGTELARLDDEEPELFEEVRQQRAKAPPRPLCKAGRGEEELPPPGTAFSHPLAFTLIQSVLLPD